MADRMGLTCPLCGAPLDPGLERGSFPGRRDACPACRRDLHACHACRLHDPNAHNQCREPKAEWQARRDRANFCDFFELSNQGPDAPGSREDERKRKLDDLFRNFGA